MLYIERGQDGKIIGIHNSPTEQAHEAKTSIDREIVDFLNDAGVSKELQSLLQLYDKDVIRVLDDLIDLLVAKNVIMFTDLPVKAQEKINSRKLLRKRINTERFLVDDIL